MSPAPNAIGWHCEVSCVHWVTGTSEGGGSARRAVAVQTLYTDFFTGSWSGGIQAAADAESCWCGWCLPCVVTGGQKIHPPVADTAPRSASLLQQPSPDMFCLHCLCQTCAPQILE